MPQITILLKPSEKDALILLADREKRRLKDQVALIVVSELQRRGLIEPMQIGSNPIDIDDEEVVNGKQQH